MSKSCVSLTLCLGLAICLSQVEGSDNSCMRGDKKPGFCVSYRECSIIFNVIRQRQRSPEDETYLRNSRCPVHKRGFVCCEEEEYEHNSTGKQILMEQSCGIESFIYCGLRPHKIIPYIRPWMALLKFKRTIEEVERFECEGTLITNRFILTAAHCLKNPENELVSVRLGEYRISTERDCILNFRHQPVCYPPIEDFGIERVFVHEEYSVGNVQNDIALIKLSTDVEFKAYIQPICLPVSRTLQRRADELKNFRVTGWAKIGHPQFSDEPMEAFVPRKSRFECENHYRQEVKQTQICAGSTGRDSCLGNSGGPLLYNSNYMGSDRFVQFGVASYGSVNCEHEMPKVYTNVGSFITWIADQIEW